MIIFESIWEGEGGLKHTSIDQAIGIYISKVRLYFQVKICQIPQLLFWLQHVSAPEMGKCARMQFNIIAEFIKVRCNLNKITKYTLIKALKYENHNA